jgi:hypothetical protein
MNNLLHAGSTIGIGGRAGKVGCHHIEAGDKAVNFLSREIMFLAMMTLFGESSLEEG